MSGLIAEYKTLAATCAATDYSNKAAVKRHNKSIKRMYEIVEAIGRQQADESPEHFAGLLDISHHKTNLFAAIHLLERLSAKAETVEKALAIIRAAAQGGTAEAIGYQVWLDNWQAKNSRQP